jgi:hypothetical protein
LNKFDEYKFFAESTQYLSDKRQNATKTYISVNLAVFTVLAFLIQDVDIKGWVLIFAISPLFLVGASVCYIWHKTLTQYKDLIGWRYGQLMEMEQKIPDSHQMYIKEWEDFFKLRQGKEKFGYSRLEVWVPKILLLLYIGFAVCLIFFTILVGG